MNRNQEGLVQIVLLIVTVVVSRALYRQTIFGVS
jgi:hypothetical protein